MIKNIIFGCIALIFLAFAIINQINARTRESKLQSKLEDWTNQAKSAMLREEKLKGDIATLQISYLNTRMELEQLKKNKPIYNKNEALDSIILRFDARFDADGSARKLRKK